MIYGICGASGVGKTTVCELVADALDMTFIKVSTSEVAKQHGFNAVGNLSLADRIALQEILLVEHQKLLNAAERPALLDRTPLDNAAYMMGEIYMASHEVLSPQERFRVSAYVERARQVTRENYDFVFHLEPLPFYEVSSTRPAENVAYQKHIDLLLRGLLTTNAGISYALIRTTDLNERQELIHDVIAQRLDQLEAMRKATPGIH